MTDYLVVVRNDGSRSVFAADPGKGFSELDGRGRVVAEHVPYAVAIDGWRRMHFCPTMGDAFADIDRPLPCPVCGRDDMLCCDSDSGTYRPMPYAVRCLDCGHSVNGVSRRDALLRWNSEYGNSLKTTQNSQKSPERGL